MAAQVTERIWLKSYRQGVPATIDDELANTPSLNFLFEKYTADYAEREAFVSIGTAMTYRQTAKRSRAFAAWLQNTGIARGDRVAIMIPNSLQYPICVFGTLLAGGTVVNVNPLYTVRELHHQLADSGAKYLIVFENFAKTAEDALPGTSVERVLITGIGDLLGGLKGIALNVMLRHVQKAVPKHRLRAERFTAALKRGATLPYRRVELGHEDIAFLQYTGGTTGVAKGAMLTHRNIIANMLQAYAWGGDQFHGEQVNNLTLLPLYHIFSLTVNLFMFMVLGGRNVLIANPRDTKRVMMIIRKERFDGMAGINTLFNAFLDNPDFRKLDFSTLRLVIAGGAATQSEVAKRWREVTGRPITEGYGLTECSPVVCINMIDLDRPDHMEFTGTVGLPIPSTEVRMRKTGGEWTAIGEPGEVCVRGPQVMRGYWNRPDETAAILDSEGWLGTGDIGVMDENGYVRLIDRVKDMILVSGFNVYPAEIEDVVMMHPDVMEVAAFGVPDPGSGERVKVVVVPKSDRLTEAELLAHCRKNLTGYKMPKLVEFRHEELPKTPVGKILRRELRQQDAAARDTSGV
ncbi:AMP-binding protein [Acidiphilium sp. AL]|nr:AMP-binding protein [Acidiphilium sp. AL]